MSEILFKDKDILTRNDEDFLCTEVDGETVIMNINTGHYFGLNSVSTDIWKIMEKPISYQELIKNLLKEYDVEQETCEKDTRPLLFQLLRFKVITKSK